MIYSTIVYCFPMFRSRPIIWFNRLTCSSIHSSYTDDHKWNLSITSSFSSYITERHHSCKNFTSIYFFLITFLFFFLKYNLLALFVLSNPNNINDIHEHIEQLSAWKCFLLARWCIRHCLYKIARDLLEILTKCVQIAIHRIWLDTLIDICQAEERLQKNINLSKADDAMDDDQNYSYLERLCETLAESGSFYESSLIKMPVRLDFDLIMTEHNFKIFLLPDTTITWKWRRSFKCHKFWFRTSLLWC